jgi:hypothetical protein
MSKKTVKLSITATPAILSLSALRCVCNNKSATVLDTVQPVITVLPQTFPLLSIAPTLSYIAAAALGPSWTSPTSIAAGDSGATGHIASMRAAIHLEDLRPALQPISVKQPDGTLICSTHRAYLPGLAHLRREAARVDIFRDQDLPHTSLMSLGKLYDAGCEAHLDAKAIVVSNPDTTPLYRGERNRATGLWDVDWRNPLPPSTSTSATNEAPAPQASPPLNALQHGGTALVALSLTSNAQRVGFYHAALGSPPVATLLTALRANILPTLPIDIDMVRKAPPTTMATAERHLDARR